MAFMCKLCENVYRWKSSARAHVYRTHCASELMAWKCEKCGSCFTMKQSLQVHKRRCLTGRLMARVRPVSAVQLPKGSPIDDQIVETDRSFGSGQFGCPHCSKKLLSKLNLSKHTQMCGLPAEKPEPVKEGPAETMMLNDLDDPITANLIENPHLLRNEDVTPASIELLAMGENAMRQPEPGRPKQPQEATLCSNASSELSRSAPQREILGSAANDFRQLFLIMRSVLPQLSQPNVTLIRETLSAFISDLYSEMARMHSEDRQKAENGKQN